MGIRLGAQSAGGTQPPPGRLIKMVDEIEWRSSVVIDRIICLSSDQVLVSYKSALAYLLPYFSCSLLSASFLRIFEFSRPFFSLAMTSSFEG